jgi:uncharacterized protein
MGPRGNPLISRRKVLKGMLAFTAGTAALGGYAVAEPWRLNVTRYQLTPRGWPQALKLRVAIVADLHACEPWMSVARIRQIVARTNALAPDLTLLLGDYVAGHRMAQISTEVAPAVWAEALAGLKAPLGVHAVLGNHDWWHDIQVQLRRRGPVPAAVALEAAGIPVYENKAVRLVHEGRPFWLAGLGDQIAFWPRGMTPPNFKARYQGVDDLTGTLAQIKDDAPVLMMAHEPDIFAVMPDRVSLTLSGHTHGGQVTLAGYAPFVPSKYGRRYLYGRITEQGRDLIVSGGLGCSALPIRFGRPPEVVLVELGGPPVA